MRISRRLPPRTHADMVASLSSDGRERVGRLANPTARPMSSRAPISDEDARRAAETTFDRNVVVVAGAGTGKTTLLVNRLVHLLMREPQPVAITQTVAFFFNDTATTEMKLRL